MHDLIPISSMSPGQTAEVRQIIGSSEQVRRMEELGVRSGAALEMVQSGTPCIVRLGATKLCFRDGELCSVLVAVRMSA